MSNFERRCNQKQKRILKFMKTVFTLDNWKIFLIPILFYGCSNEKTIKDISITLNQTMQYQQVFPILQAADSILTRNMTAEEIQKEKNRMNDTSLSMEERKLAINKLQPLTSSLYPLFIVQPSGEYLIAQSSFIGYALNKDTIKVNECLSNQAIQTTFPQDIQFKWTKAIDIDSAFYLSAVYKKSKPIQLDQSNIEFITIQPSAIFKESVVYKTTAALLHKTQYVIILQLNQDGFDKLEELPQEKNAALISVILNDKKYTSSLTVENIYDGIVIGESINQNEVDSIKANYNGLIKEE